MNLELDTRYCIVTWYVMLSISVGHSIRVNGRLLCGNKLPNGFLDRPRWPESLQEKIPQSGQHFCRSLPNFGNELLQGGHA